MSNYTHEWPIDIGIKKGEREERMEGGRNKEMNKQSWGKKKEKRRKGQNNRKEELRRCLMGRPIPMSALS